MKTKEAELFTSVLLYTLRCIAEGDHIALQNMGLSIADAEQLRKINLLELFYIDSLRTHCLNISFNRAALPRMINFMVSQQKNDQKLQRILDHDAPYNMVAHFFGLPNGEYTRRRKSRIGMTLVGRAQELNDQQFDKLVYLWKHIKEKDSCGRLHNAEDYVDLAEKTGASLRSVWTTTERWVDSDPMSEC